jgi:hypothetical protein
LPGVSDTENTAVAVLLIDTAGCELNELDLIDNESKGNEGNEFVLVKTLRFVIIYLQTVVINHELATKQVILLSHCVNFLTKLLRVGKKTVTSLMFNYGNCYDVK